MNNVNLKTYTQTKVVLSSRSLYVEKEKEKVLKKN